MAQAYIAVASNLDPEKHITEAVIQLHNLFGIRAISGFHGSKPWFGLNQSDFINGVVCIETKLLPRIIKWEKLRPLESMLGRIRTGDRYADRTIDLDLLLYDDWIIREPDMVLPDPDISSRPFLAIPLFEIAPQMILPGSGIRLSDIVAGMNRNQLIPLREFSLRLEEYIHES